MRRWFLVMGVLALLAVTLSAWALGRGTAEYSPAVQETLWQLRLWRLLLAGQAGVCLAVAGVLMQGLFRNPLADPGIVGVGAGASLGGVVALLGWHAVSRWTGTTFGLSPELIVPVSCFVGALATMAILLALLRFTGSTMTVLLAGVVLTIVLGGVGALVRHLVQEDWQLARAAQGFLSGTLGDKGWRHVAVALPLAAATVTMAWWWSPPMNMLASGEDEAQSLGLELSSTRRWLIIWAGVGVASAVAVAGNVAFVGLLVPHLARRLVGPDHRLLVPTAALAGWVFVIAADAVAHAVGGAVPLPLGVVTGLLGAPAFALILLRRSGKIV